MVGDFGHVAPRGHAGDPGEHLDHLGDARFPDAPLGGVVELEESFDGGQQADDLLLADLHAAADAHVGLIACRPAAIRSARPSSKPELCGPRRAFPPENATRSNPWSNILG